jgi:hypothetical protein
MPSVHRVGDQRACGAVTVDTGLNTKVLAEGMPVAVAGMVNNHSMLGALISASPGKVLIQGIPMIVAMMDQSAPDQIGLVQHVTNFPTPMTGSQKVKGYSGSFGGGLGNIAQGFGGLMNGEFVSLAGQIIGQVTRFTAVGGNSGLAILNNLQGAGLTNLSGRTITGQTSGNQFTFSGYQVDGNVDVNFNNVFDEDGAAVVLETGEQVTL